MKTQKSTAAQRGFTLVELVAVLAITAIIAAFAVPPMLSYSEMGHQMNRDNIARTIYLAAQNRLTELRLTNNLKEELTNQYYVKTTDSITNETVYTIQSDLDLNASSTNVGKKLGDVDANLAEDSANAPYLHYISKQKGETDLSNPVLKLLDPIFLDKTVLNDAILMEYNIRTGVVFSVFYGEHAEEFTYIGANDDSVIGARGMGEGGYTFAEKRRQGYYGVGKTGSIDNQLPTTINVYDSSERHLPDDVNKVYDNVLYAELLVPTKNLQTGANFDLRINGITVEKVDLSKFNTSGSFQNDSLPYYDSSGANNNDCLLYRYDTGLVEGMARFIWILDYVGGDMANSATGNNIRHSIGVKYAGKADLNQKTGLGNTAATTLKLDGTSNLRVSVAGSAIAESSTEAHPYYLTQTQSSNSAKRFAVKTARHLYNVRSVLDGTFTQMANIDLAKEYNKIENFAPIGLTWDQKNQGWTQAPFKGTYMGTAAGATSGGDVIRNLSIALPGQDTVGLFATIEKSDTNTAANLLGLSLQNPSVQGKNNVGALSGALTTGFISDCAVYYTSDSVKTISGTQNVGGMVGVNTSGRVMDSVFLSPTAQIHVVGQDNSHTGGIVGDNKITASLQRLLYLARAPHSSDEMALYPFVGKDSGLAEDKQKQLYYLSGFVDENKRPRPQDFSSTAASVDYNMGTVTLGTPMGTYDIYQLNLATQLNDSWKTKKTSQDAALTVTEVLSKDNQIYPYPYQTMLETTLPRHPNWPIVDNAFSARMLYYEIYATDDKEDTADYGVYQTQGSMSFAEEALIGKPLLDNRKIMEDGYLFYCDKELPGQSTKLFVSSSPSGDNYVTKATGNTEEVSKLGGIKAILLDMEQLQAVSLGGKPIYLRLSKGAGNNNADKRNYYEGYINPLFAKAIYNNTTEASNTRAYSIRTPRQMNNIGHVQSEKIPGDYAAQFHSPLSEDLTYTQEIDMDFGGLNTNTGYQMWKNPNERGSQSIDSSKSVVPGQFLGLYQGNQKEIRALTVQGANGNENTGLFANNAGTIQQVTLKDSVIGNGTNVGGIAASNSGTIRTSSLQYSTVTGAAQTVGGIVGKNTESGIIEDVYFLSMNDPTVSPVSGNGTVGGIVGGIVGSHQGTISRALYLAPAPYSTANQNITLYPIAGKDNKKDEGNYASCFYLSGSRYSLDNGKTWPEDQQDQITKPYNLPSGGTVFGDCTALTTSFFDKSWLAADYSQPGFTKWQQQPRMEDDTVNMRYPYPIPPAQEGLAVRWPLTWPLANSPVRREQKDRDFPNPKPPGNSGEEIKFTNGSFDEKPEDPFTTHIITHMDHIDGWSTRPTNKSQAGDAKASQIELQYPYLTTKKNKNDFAYSDAKGGKSLYAELDAHLPGTLYQVAPTTPGKEFYYSFFHMARLQNWESNLNKMNFYLTGVGRDAAQAEADKLVLIRPCWSARSKITENDKSLANKGPKDNAWNVYAKDTIYYGEVKLPYYQGKLDKFDGKAHLYDVWMPQLGYGITVWSDMKINDNSLNFPEKPSQEGATYENQRKIPFHNDQYDKLLAEAFYTKYKDQILGYWDVSYGWKQYYGSYTVPDGQVRTEFAYQSNSDNSDSSTGNFLDDITFRSPAFLTVDQYAKVQNTDGTSKEVSFVKPGDEVQIELHVKNLGELAAKDISIDNQFAPFDDYISYQKDSVKVYSGTNEVKDVTFNQMLDDSNKTLSIKLPEAVALKTGETLRVTFALKVNTWIENEESLGSSLLYYFRNQAKVSYADDEFAGFAKRDNVSNIVKIAIDPIRLSKTMEPNPVIVQENAKDFTVTLTIADITEGQSMKSSGMITDIIPPGFTLYDIPEGASQETSGENTILIIPNVALTDNSHSVSYQYKLRYTGDGYGIRYTSIPGVSNIGADYRYRFQDASIAGIAERVSVLIGFPQTVIAIRPTLQNDEATVGNIGATLDITANDTSLSKKYAYDNYNVTPKIALTDESGLEIKTIINGNQQISTDQYTATLNRGTNSLSFLPKTNADGNYTLYYRVFLTAQKPGVPDFLLDSKVATVTITVKNSDKRVYYEKYDDNNYGFYTGEESQTVLVLDDTKDVNEKYKQIVEAGYGVLSRSSDRAIAVDSGDAQTQHITITLDEVSWYLYAPSLTAKKDWNLSTLNFGTLGSMASVAKLHPNFAKAIYPNSVTDFGSNIYIRTQAQQDNLATLESGAKTVHYEHGTPFAKALMSKSFLAEEATTLPEKSMPPEEIPALETIPKLEEVQPAETPLGVEEALPPKEILGEDAAIVQQEGEERSEGRRRADVKKRGGGDAS